MTVMCEEAFLAYLARLGSAVARQSPCSLTSGAVPTSITQELLDVDCSCPTSCARERHFPLSDCDCDRRGESVAERRARLTLLAANGEGLAFTERRAAWRGVAEQKVNKIIVRCDQSLSAMHNAS
jgi:hypothetical protein